MKYISIIIECALLIVSIACLIISFTTNDLYIGICALAGILIAMYLCMSS